MTLPPFQQLLDAHGSDVFRFLVATVGRSDADDCYQETWISALRAYPRLRDDSNLRGWILTVAHRKALDQLRAASRRAEPIGDALDRAAIGGVEAPFAASDGLPEVWASVRSLPSKQRTAIALRFLTGSSHAEIAAVMHTSEEAARRNVHEGLKRLRREYRNDSR
ncbi:MAG: sigma-70 family RNA polymerase sigma factor [Solirubrobacterales bacterium]|nr:sigma-70 family RNA polymerase sigma factor [Solirubrobacterales bacterium]